MIVACANRRIAAQAANVAKNRQMRDNMAPKFTINFREYLDDSCDVLETSATMTPWQRYQKDLERPDFQKDSAQEDAVKRLQSLYDKLVEAERDRTKPKAKLFRKLKKARKSRSRACISGVG